MIVPYNSNAATAYAVRWARSRNPDFYDYAQIGGDCTNFVSQCVYAGSLVMNYTPDFGWYYINANDKSPSWTGVQFFYNFMTTNEGAGPFAREASLSELTLGDVIQLGDENGVYYHSLILTGIRQSRRRKSYYVSAHSQDALNRNLASYSFQSIRGIHFLGVRILQ